MSAFNTEIAEDQHFSGFKNNCSHKRAHQHLEVIALSVLERTETGKNDQHFYEEYTIVLIMYQCVFTFLDVNLVLHVQTDLNILLQLHNHGKKDVFSGLIVKHSCEHAWIENTFRHALRHSKKKSRE